jgi:hypothetical protein
MGDRVAYRVLWADGRAACWFVSRQLASAWRRMIANKPFGCPVGPIRKMEVPKGARVYDYVPEWKG